ncbi:putative C6 transcription factor [Hypomontagnella submonticulosa]|nr:putative C6 transcription factor [Hypomontagnella submonticulosa]
MKRIEKPSDSIIPTTVDDLKADLLISYKLKVLLFDLRNIRNPDSERRILSTLDELYISTPYFTAEEAARVKRATTNNLEPRVSHHEQSAKDDAEASGGDGQTTESAVHIGEVHVGGCQDRESDTSTIQTVEEAIHTRLENFFQKRKASGDMRPCGPHDMAPVYESVFGISPTELNDERFQSRLRRQGLPATVPVPVNRPDNQKGNPDEGKKDAKKGRKGRK